MPETLMTVPHPELLFTAYSLASPGADDLAPMNKLVARVRPLVEEMGLPCFLRTDQTSGKFEWERTCYLLGKKRLAQNLFHLLEFNYLADLEPEAIMVREFLPLKTLAVSPVYHNMPLAREFRVFVFAGMPVCNHFYWPREAREKAGCGDVEFGTDSLTGDERDRLYTYARRLARRLPPDSNWSMDFAQTTWGEWYFIDAARAELSWHEEGCEINANLPTDGEDGE
jgi:hypothetical protein